MGPHPILTPNNITVYKALVESHLRYADVVWGSYQPFRDYKIVHLTLLKHQK